MWPNDRCIKALSGPVSGHWHVGKGVGRPKFGPLIELRLNRLSPLQLTIRCVTMITGGNFAPETKLRDKQMKEKHKYHVCITNPLEYATGNCLDLRLCHVSQELDEIGNTQRFVPDSWVIIDTIELEIDVDMHYVRQVATEELDNRERAVNGVHHKRMADIQSSRDKLLAIAHDPINGPREGDATSAYVNQD